MTGRGGGQVVSLLALYSDDSGSNPADVCNVENHKDPWKQRIIGRFVSTFNSSSPLIGFESQAEYHLSFYHNWIDTCRYLLLMCENNENRK